VSKWNPRQLAALNEVLANFYPLDSDARRVATKVGLKPATIAFESKAISTWFNVLQNADARELVDAIVEAALEDFPGDESLLQARDQAPPVNVKGPDARQWSGPATSATLERLMGPKSTLVPISYLEIGLRCARSVVRIKREDGGLGTGFVTDGNLLITNNHVLPNSGAAEQSVVQFNYQAMPDGTNAPYEEAALDVESFQTSAEDDWSAIRIKGDLPAKWGSLPLKRTAVSAGDHVNIIQHPGGGPKQISLSANVVAFVGGGRVQYLTDTLPGSSGSPVFDARWNVVALHHSGGWLSEPNSTTKTTFYRNEGISIDRILDALGMP